MNFKSLYDKSPQELKDIVMSQWDAKQNPKHHPEGNTLKHIITVTNRAFKHFPDSPDIQLAAYFHDLGKLATAGVNPKTGQPTAYGHEGEGVGLVDKYKSFIEKQGANPEIVRYIVKNHMKIKPSTWDVMKQKKKDPIMNDPSFDKLMKFGDIDKGGLNLQERIRKLVRSILNENTADDFVEDLDNIDKFLGDRNNAEYDWREEETYVHSESWKEQGSNLELNTDFDKFYDELETNGPQTSGNVTFKAGPKDVYGKKITYTVNESKKLNEADFKNIQSIIDENPYVKGTANEKSIIETDKHILFISPEGLKHIKERHSDRSKPGSIITGDLKDIITKTIQKSPSESSGGRVKWLDIKIGNVGEMGVAKATPEEVSGMTDYTMPDGRKETVKIKQGQRPKTDVFNVITAEIGKDSGKPVLSIITAFPGPNSIDGVEMPMDRNEFAEKGFYFIVNKKLNENMKPNKEILRMKKLAGLITESEIKQILKEKTIEGQDAVGAFMDAEKLTVDGEPLSDDIVKKLNNYISDLRIYRDTGSDEPDFGEIDEFVQQYAGKDITDEDGDKLEFTEQDVEDYTETFDEGAGYERMNQSDLSFGFE